MDELENTLKERGSRYGTMAQNGKVSQLLKRSIQLGESWDSMSDDKKESLEMICHKISRIVNGDPVYVDSWHDIGGYARLIEESL